jgi:hypothetical protein
MNTPVGLMFCVLKSNCLYTSILDVVEMPPSRTPPLGPIGPQGPQFPADNDDGDVEMNLIDGPFVTPGVTLPGLDTSRVSSASASGSSTRKKTNKSTIGTSTFPASRAPAAPATNDPLADHGAVWAAGARRKKRRTRGKCSLSAAERKERSSRALEAQRRKRAEREANPPPPLPESGPIPRPDGQHGREYHAGYLLHMYGAPWNAVTVIIFPFNLVSLYTDDHSPSA